MANLKEKLAESETLMKEMSLTWEQKLKNTEKIHQVVLPSIKFGIFKIAYSND